MESPKFLYAINRRYTKEWIFALSLYDFSEDLDGELVSVYELKEVKRLAVTRGLIEAEEPA